MSSSIEEALKNAKYNEAVVVTVDEPDGGSREVVLIATLDKVNGGVSWQDASQDKKIDVDEGMDVGILRHIRTKMWVMPMLNDAHRNSLYETAIREACHAVLKKLPEEGESDAKKGERKIRLLDIGAGTGLLAMMASQCMKELSPKSDVESTSVEMASAMARLAKMTIDSNTHEGVVCEVKEGHSCELQLFDDDERAVLCTSELLESGLLGEGIIPAMRDAWDRHLSKDAIVVPQRARIYAQVLEGGHLINNFQGPKVDLPGVSLRPSSNDNDVLLGGDGGFIVPLHAESLFANKKSGFQLGCGPGDDDKPWEYGNILSEPSLVLEFDFTSQKSIPQSSGRTCEVELTCTKSGKAQAVLFWWELDLWNGNTYSTQLDQAPWQDHWQQCLFIFGSDNANVTLTEGSTFTLIACHDDTSISFNISNGTNSSEQPAKKQKCDNNDPPKTHRNISPERALQLNDQQRMNTLFAAIERAINIKGKGACVLDISDFSLCSVIAARKCNAQRVTSLESSTNGVPMLSARVAQLGNGLPMEGTEFQVVNAHAENLTTDIIYGSQVDIIMAEPYYEVLEGWHLQEALNYYHLVRSMKRRGLLADNFISVPSFASIVGCAVQFDKPILKAHCGLNDSTICGFRHDDVSKYGAKFSSFDMKFPIARGYHWKRLSDDFTLARFDYEGKMELKGDSQWAQAPLNDGTCHGIIVWVEYGLRCIGDEGKELISKITTGDKNHQQAVRFLPSPVSISNHDPSMKSHMNIYVKPTFMSCEGSFEDHDFEIKIE